MTNPIATRAAAPGRALAAFCALSVVLAAPVALAEGVDDAISKRVGPWLITHAAGEHACHAALRLPEGVMRLNLSHRDDWNASGSLNGDGFAAAAGRPMLTLAGQEIPGAEAAAEGDGASLALRFAGAEPLSAMLLSGGLEFVLEDGTALMFPAPNGLGVLSELVNCAEAVRPVPGPTPGA